MKFFYYQIAPNNYDYLLIVSQELWDKYGTFERSTFSTVYPEVTKALNSQYIWEIMASVFATDFCISQEDEGELSKRLKKTGYIFEEKTLLDD